MTYQTKSEVKDGKEEQKPYKRQNKTKDGKSSELQIAARYAEKMLT